MSITVPLKLPMTDVPKIKGLHATFQKASFGKRKIWEGKKKKKRKENIKFGGKKKLPCLLANLKTALSELKTVFASWIPGTNLGDVVPHMVVHKETRGAGAGGSSWAGG